MSTLQIQGGYPLRGEIKVQGSKNAVLPIMAASLLHKGVSVIENVPYIDDVHSMREILEELGAKTKLEQHCLSIDASQLSTTSIPLKTVQKMRSSITILGALLGRANEAVTYYPGGCSIGKRPIDLHLSGLEKLGASVEVEGIKIHASAARLSGAEVSLIFPSVGATENIILAAVKAEGMTVIHGAAKEPEVVEMCCFLRRMGAKIQGDGTDTVAVFGGAPLHDVVYRVSGDRIVAGTYLAATAAAGGEVTVAEISPEFMSGMVKELVYAGCSVSQRMDSITISAPKRLRAIPYIKTAPYPGFPTDMQSQFMAALISAEGVSVLEETIFEDRFKTAFELQKMGADIRLEGGTAVITGVKRLQGADVTAKDLRGGAALVVAALSAEGESRIDGCEYIQRGYEAIDRDLVLLGGRIRW